VCTKISKMIQVVNMLSERGDVRRHEKALPKKVVIKLVERERLPQIIVEMHIKIIQS